VASKLLTHDEPRLEIYDDRHSQEEDRFVAIGRIAQGIIVVIYAEPSDDLMRLISARFATRREKQAFLRFFDGAHQE
jgi:uncharacterized protein